ncbi:MAG: dTDP-4-dehydrorhamnose 3,5-epimerase [Ignavibacteriaceae bacterium]
MFFRDLEIKDVKFILPQKLEDSRGFFSRSFCQNEFENIGIDFKIKQTNISYNKFKGTIRGMHYQLPPFEEAKIVSCVRGSIKDYIIDLRHDSSTYCKWISVELNSEEYTSIYIPKGLAHGFQTLKNDTVVNYLMSEFYNPDATSGIRWDDKLFNIKWHDPKNFIISEKDKNYPDFKN